MRKIAANLIFPVSSAPVKDAYLLIDDEGKVVDLVKYSRTDKEIAGLEYYSGVLVPGFVNAHCHLELSHLKNKVEKGKGLSEFVKQIQCIRQEPQNTIEKLMQKSLRYMWSRGISGLGDLVNSPYGVNEKQLSKILIHNFIELFNENQKSSEEIISKGKVTIDALQRVNQSASFCSHSLYGTNLELVQEIIKASLNKESTSLHFLESKWEGQLNIESIIKYLEILKPFERILLVHNMNLTQSLFNQIQKQFVNQIYWVLCPNSNLYIKSQLPPISDFFSWGMKPCLGTDSLASNQQLSIFEEMKTISEQFPEIPFNEILKWGTLNGAEALGFNKVLGSFNAGKKPGVVLISDFDFKKNKINTHSDVTRLV